MNSHTKKIRAMGWFLTYPHCTVSKEEALAHFESHFKVAEYVIAREEHKDGTPHLHVFLKVQKKI